MGFMFCELHVPLNNPSSGDINSLNLSCWPFATPMFKDFVTFDKAMVSFVTNNKPIYTSMCWGVSLLD